MELPSSLPIETVQTVLDYISPPSCIPTTGLPRHLLSTELLQRHHFLKITADDPAYLAWPSPHASEAVLLLEEFIKPMDDADYSKYPTRYGRFDPESLCAFVRISVDHEVNAPLLKFQLENDGWKFHDTRLSPPLSPFPKNTYSSLQDASSAHLISQMEDQSNLQFLEEHGIAELRLPSEDDSYWDSYGQDVEADQDNSQPVNNAGSEDAYWAQYSTVHGSADSENPSPRVSKHPTQLSEPIRRLEHMDNHSKLSADRLMDRLNNIIISPRSDALTTSDRSSDGSSSPDSFKSNSGLSSDTSTPSHPPGLVEDIDQPDVSKMDGSRPLKDSIKGIFQMWQSARASSTESDKVEFLQIIQDALQEI